MRLKYGVVDDNQTAVVLVPSPSPFRHLFLFLIQDHATQLLNVPGQVETIIYALYHLGFSRKNGWQETIALLYSFLVLLLVS